jgi:hypothetical protein
VTAPRFLLRPFAEVVSTPRGWNRLVTANRHATARRRVTDTAAV